MSHILKSTVIPLPVDDLQFSVTTTADDDGTFMVVRYEEWTTRGVLLDLNDREEVEGRRFKTQAAAISYHNHLVITWTPIICPECAGHGGWSYDDHMRGGVDVDCELCDGDGHLFPHQLKEIDDQKR